MSVSTQSASQTSNNQTSSLHPRHSYSPLSGQPSVKAGKILSRYVKKNALIAMILAVLALWGLQVLFSALSEIEDLSDSYTYIDALTYIFYKSPYYLEQFMPTGALLGAVVGLGLLANNAELIVMRAAGISVYRIVGWALQPAFIFVLLGLVVNQYVLPQTNLLANQVRKPDAKLLASVNGYWTMQQHGNGSNNKTETDKQVKSSIVFIDYADADGNIGEVKRWQLDDNNNLIAVSKAAGGKYMPNKTNASSVSNDIDNINNTTNHFNWQLDDIATLELTTPNLMNNTVDDVIMSDEPIVTQHNKQSEVMTLPISPSSVYLLTRRAEDLSLTQLYAHQKFNTEQGTRSLEHELAFWQKLLSPFAILSLVIVACSFVFGSLRTHSLGLRIVVAIIFGLLFSYMQDLTGFVALATGASPLVMVLLPIIGSTLLGLYLLKRQS